MDALADLKARALKAREFVHIIGECEFTLRAPTMLQVREEMHSRGLTVQDSDAMTLPLLQHYLLLKGLVGWAGVRMRDLFADGGESPVEWSAAAAEVYIDANPGQADELGAALFAAARLRAERVEADAKN